MIADERNRTKRTAPATSGVTRAKFTIFKRRRKRANTASDRVLGRSAAPRLPLALTDQQAAREVALEVSVSETMSSSGARRMSNGSYLSRYVADLSVESEVKCPA